MGKKDNDVLIKEAIDATLKFEELMDSIDFNSYLPKKEEPNYVRKSSRFKIYRTKLLDALKLCRNVIKGIPKEIKTNTPSEPLDENKLTQYLIYRLFEAKKIRLRAREQTKWVDEKKELINAKYELHKAFVSIPLKDFQGEVSDDIYNKNNWAKVLYYNEMAICHAGLIESSMSLGYAEEAIFILETIRPNLKKSQADGRDENDEIFKLYTFALCNKGEAEWSLRDYDKALWTFNKIMDKFERIKKSSDYYQALFRFALILIDEGRSEEAIKILERMGVLEEDTRYGARDLEKASALIDQKKYEEASDILEDYTKNLWVYTFTFRKAALYKIRCLLEWRKNKPTEFKEDKKEEWKREYENIPKEINGDEANNIEGIIKKCIDRKDEGNFKKACRYFSEFHKLEKRKIRNKSSKKDKEEARELEKKVLWGYFLYLFYEKMDENLQNMLQKENWENLKEKLQQDDNYLNRMLDEIIEDTEYMKDFFYSYKNYLENSQDDCKKDIIIEKLYKRLRDLYREKDELQEMEKIERDYNVFKELLKPKQETDQGLKGEVVKFITTKFFKTKPPNNKQDRIYLSSNTIENRMYRNTDEFADKILGSSKHIFPSEGNKINGILTVLRRWNSFTPSLSSPASPSRGGGYFLYFKDGNGKSTGIVVDPGYDFLDNLFFEGFTISDIDVVLISHAHPDHTDNFPKMLTLFHEMNGRLKEWKEKTKEYDRKHIKIILSQGVFNIFSKQMDYSRESLKDIYVVDTKAIERNDNKPVECYKEQISNGKELKIEAIRTSHGDLSQWESIGFLFSIGNNEQKIQIGYTSDAKWSKEFAKNFSDCSIICAHLGSIVNILNDKDFCNTFCKEFSENDNDGKCKKLDECKKSGFKNAEINETNLIEQTRDENHLYLAGLSLFFDSLFKNSSNLKLGIVSEFGEELKGGIRMDLYHKFDDWFRDGKGKSKSIHRRCLPGDIGLRVDIFSGDVFCQTCQRYVDRKKINPIAYGKEEAIFFVCDECKSVLSTYQIEEKLKDYCENGCKLELKV